MHDEAAPHYIDMIDQTTLGHLFIKKEFDQTPRIGWQIDSFGHSAVQAYLLSAEVGFDAIYFGRMDYQDRAKRRDEKRLEFVWQGSKTLGSSAQIFTGAFPIDGYEPPQTFYFEVNDNSPIVQVSSNVIRLHINGVLVGEKLLHSLLKNKSDSKGFKQITLVADDGANDRPQGYVHHVQILPQKSSVRDHFIKASCRKNFTLDVVLLDAFGSPANGEMEVLFSA